MLKELKVSDKWVDKIMRLAELDKIELDDSGKIKDAETLKTKAAEEYADYIVKVDENGAAIDDPPAGATGKKPEDMSFAEYKEWRKNEK